MMSGQTIENGADNMNKHVIYQMALRSFTPEGTLKAAEKLLPHVASLGVDIVYLCPVFVAENDEDQSTWSQRQIASNTNNPKNPYKIADYFNVDEEYGTNEDLKSFVLTAHENGLKVFFDLVYLHCGKNAVFIKDHPDFVEQDETGKPLVGDCWPFARLNFKNPNLRKYLIKNMEMFVKDYKVDGFRCDVGDSVPLDFWNDAFSYLKTINPDLITLNEGINPEYIKNTFDMGYDFSWASTTIKVFSGEASTTELKSLCKEKFAVYGENYKKCIKAIENHDIASDQVLNRNEITMTSKGVEAALVLCYTMGGVPLIWNGSEFCDNLENCMFSNRFHGKRSQINWSKAFTAEGKQRLQFIKELNALYHDHDEFLNGKFEWIENSAPDEVLAYKKGNITIIVNTKNKKVSDIDCCADNIYMQYGASISDNKLNLEGYGYIIAKG